MNPCIVLPTKNEEESIAYMIREIKKLNIPLLVIDEQSTDKTVEIANSEGVEVFQRNGSGKGAGVVSAVELVDKKGYDVIVLIDCDTSYSPKHIPELLKHFPTYDLVIGRRRMAQVKFLHRLPNIAHTQAINMLFGSRLHDINSGLRAFNVKKMHGLLNASGFDIEAQITIKAIKHNFTIKEIPIDYTKRLGNSKVRIRDGYIILKRIFLERFTKN